VIFGVAVVLPVVITFSVAGVLAGRHAQAAVQGFFQWSSPSALICRVLRAERSRPSLLVRVRYLLKWLK